MKKLDCLHVDTCLSDYWSGHHLPHVCIPVWHGMTLKEIKQAIHQEIIQDAIAGADYDWTNDAWERRAHAAINRIRPRVKGTRRFFLELEKTNEEESELFEPVYAFFIFTEQE